MTDEQNDTTPGRGHERSAQQARALWGGYAGGETPPGAGTAARRPPIATPPSQGHSLPRSAPNQWWKPAKGVGVIVIVVLALGIARFATRDAQADRAAKEQSAQAAQIDQILDNIENLPAPEPITICEPTTITEGPLAGSPGLPSCREPTKAEWTTHPDLIALCDSYRDSGVIVPARCRPGTTTTTAP